MAIASEFPTQVAGQQTRIIETTMFMGRKQRVLATPGGQFKDQSASVMIYAVGMDRREFESLLAGITRTTTNGSTRPAPEGSSEHEGADPGLASPSTCLLFEARGEAAHCEPPPLAHWRRVASALVPAAHVTPFALEYIARSTTMRAGVGPMLSTSVPNRRPAASGNSAATALLNRLLGGTVNVRVAVVPSSKNSVVLAVAAHADVFATRTYVAISLSPPSSPPATPTECQCPLHRQSCALHATPPGCWLATTSNVRR